MDLQALPALTSLSNCVTIVEQDNIKIVRVLHEKATAGISLFGGHVVSFQPQGQPDLLWMSEKVILDGTMPLRGGIPVCWPWFGSIASPSHGFVRTKEWQLVEHRESDEGVVVTLGLKSDDTTLAIWPYQFSLLLHVEISDRLKVSLDITNTDHKPWTFSSALHTYLNIGDVQQISITGMGTEYLDKLQDFKSCQGGEILTLTDTVDRIYTAPEAQLNMNDPVFNREVTIENTGHNSAVLWNPWHEGSIAIHDMAATGYQTMFCIESTIFSPCLSAGVTLQPEEHHLLTTTVSSSL